ncbi:MAG: hypothetical protein R2834_23120 [Rhodothermales bacterium]
MRYAATLLLLSASMLACNEPPLYATRAEDALRARGMSPTLIEHFIDRHPLEPDEARELAGVDDAAVLHLLGANVGTPEDILRTLAAHPDPEVRSGVASNPAAPVELLVALREQGHRSVYHGLAGNAGMPAEVLRALFDDEAAAWSAFASNPALPDDLKLLIAREGDAQALYAMSLNPQLAPEVLATLHERGDESVRSNLEQRVAWGWD